MCITLCLPSTYLKLLNICKSPSSRKENIGCTSLARAQQEALRGESSAAFAGLIWYLSISFFLGAYLYLSCSITLPTPRHLYIIWLKTTCWSMSLDRKDGWWGRGCVLWARWQSWGIGSPWSAHVTDKWFGATKHLKSGDMKCTVHGSATQTVRALFSYFIFPSCWTTFWWCTKMKVWSVDGLYVYMYVCL